ncbi:hypothetical protein BROOK1789C_1119 [Bathymodiolus brooksi thiotrophic gill symbiont]|nr:hypothetical protein BROOK1789C_1119 [Bathymodiolus brooksi thiotrophic gill symbiont]
MFRQADLSQFFLGNSGPLKRQNEQRTQYFRDYEKSKRSRQFLKPEWKQNRPWLVDTETGWFVHIAKNKKNENSFTTGCTSYKHPHHMSSSKSPRNLISTINF